MPHVFFHVFIFKYLDGLSISVDKQHIVNFLFPLPTTSLLPSLLLNELIVSFFINELICVFFDSLPYLDLFSTILFCGFFYLFSSFVYLILLMWFFCPLFVLLVVWKYPTYHCFSKISLLWYTLHTLQFTHLKCIIQ